MSEVSVLIDLFDHEIIKIETVIQALNKSSGKARQLEGFRREAIERFEEIGFTVQVKTFSTNVEGAFAFDIDIVGRCQPLAHGFDHTQQAWEVQQDILGIDAPGAIQPDGSVRSPSQHTLFSDPSSN